MKKVILFSLILVLAAGSSAWASLMSGGIANNNGGIMMNAFGSTLFWSIDKSGSDWVYTYEFTPSGNNRGVAFVDLEVGNVPADLSYTFEYTTKDPTGVAGLTGTVPTTTLQARTIDVRINPNVVSSGLNQEPAGIKQYQSFLSKTNISGTDISVYTLMNGIQWTLPSWPFEPTGTASWNGQAARQDGMYRGFNSGFKLTLTTTAAPMWGDFYLDGGDWTTNNGWLMARNTQYDNSTRPDFVLGQDQLGWLAVPGSAPVPIPPSMFLFGSGLFGLFFFRRRKVTV
jgi:hypothetical protein